MDAVIRVFSLFGLAFLLFLAGLEIDFDRLRGRPLRLARRWVSWSPSALALLVGGLLAAAGQVEDGLIVAIILSATSLGVVVPAAEGRRRGRQRRSASSRSRRPRSPTSRPSSC